VRRWVPALALALAILLLLVTAVPALADATGNAGLDQLDQLIQTWIGYAQKLVGSIGALAFVLAFIWKMTAVEPRSVSEAKRWIGRIVVGTIGVEMASSLVSMVLGSTTH
jgi:hypothetical protein